MELSEQVLTSEELIHPAKPYHYIVQLHETPQTALLKELSNYVKVLNYFPDHAYIVTATPVQASALRAHPAVRWVGLYAPSFKYLPEVVAEDLSGTAAGSTIVRIDLFSDADIRQTRIDIEKLGARILKTFSQPSNRWRIEVPSGRLAVLAQIADVQWIETEGKREVRNNTTRWVIQSNVNNQTSVWDHGIHGEGQVIGHIDTLIDNSSCYLQPAKFVAIHNQSGGPVDSHGTATAGTLVGDQAPYGSADNGDGNAFAAKITHRNLVDLNGGITLYSALQTNHGDGARVHSNSWGDDTTNAYTQDAHDIDRFSSEREDDLVIFSVSNTATIKSPENAKNVLAVGGSSQAPNQANYCAGGTGPTPDGRTKPEIFAPGCGIITANTSSCGLSTVSGTSYATAAVGAAATLVRQYFTNGFYPTGTAQPGDGFTPTGTLIKAALLNSAVDMTGVSSYPNNVEGWGRVLLEESLYFAGDTRRMILRDVRHSQGFPTGSTNSDVYSFNVNSSDSLRVTLVWADVESPVGAQGSLINDLDLEVTTPNGVFKGNVFSGGQSSTGGTFDNLNNVEQVAINNPSGGSLIIRVSASDIANGPQGYALVVSGDVLEPTGPPVTLFSDDFNDGNADGWAFLGKGSGGVASSQLELSVIKKETAIPAFGGCDNCIISADVNVSAFRGAIQFSYRNKANFREVRLEPDKDRVVIIEKKNGDRIHKQIIPQILNSGQNYQVEVRALGSDVIVSIDGAVIFNAPWGDVPSGEFRLLCKEGSCRFDNVLVQQ